MYIWLVYAWYTCIRQHSPQKLPFRCAVIACCFSVWPYPLSCWKEKQQNITFVGWPCGFVTLVIVCIAGESFPVSYKAASIVYSQAQYTHTKWISSIINAYKHKHTRSASPIYTELNWRRRRRWLWEAIRAPRKRNDCDSRAKLCRTEYNFPVSLCRFAFLFFLYCNFGLIFTRNLYVAEYDSNVFRLKNKEQIDVDFCFSNPTPAFTTNNLDFFTVFTGLQNNILFVITFSLSPSGHFALDLFSGKIAVYFDITTRSVPNLNSSIKVNFNGVSSFCALYFIYFILARLYRMWMWNSVLIP